jgi:hypothetical protein
VTTQVLMNSCPVLLQKNTLLLNLLLLQQFARKTSRALVKGRRRPRR